MLGILKELQTTDFRTRDECTGPERTRALFGPMRSPDATLIGIADPQ
jgi:hypothetical protein